MMGRTFGSLPSSVSSPVAGRGPPRPPRGQSLPLLGARPRQLARSPPLRTAPSSQESLRTDSDRPVQRSPARRRSGKVAWVSAREGPLTPLKSRSSSPSSTSFEASSTLSASLDSKARRSSQRWPGRKRNARTLRFLAQSPGSIPTASPSSLPTTPWRRASALGDGLNTARSSTKQARQVSAAWSVRKARAGSSKRLPPT